MRVTKKQIKEGSTNKLFIFELLARLLYGKDYQKHLEKPPKRRTQKRRRR